MSMSDDPRGFRRGQGGGRDRDYPQRQGHGGRAERSADDRYDPYRHADQAPQPPARGQRPPQPPQPAPDKQQAPPSFSAYKPEAYAQPEPSGSSSSQDHSDWDAPVSPSRNSGPAPRNAPPVPDLYAPAASDPYAQPSSLSRDSFYSDAASDPYAPRSQQGFDNPPQARGGYKNDWSRDNYHDADTQQFGNYYSPAADEPQQTNAPDAQSMHDRFFAHDNGLEDVPQPSSGGRYASASAFDDHDFDRNEPSAFDDEPSQNFGRQPVAGFDREPEPRRSAPPAAPAAYDAPQPDPRRADPRGYDNNYGEEQYYEWDNYDQEPAPKSLQPSRAPAIPEDDMDADFFADDDEYDADDYEPERSGGRKKLMAAVLTGAVVVGGGLAYVYKTASGDGGSSGPELISADQRPVKEEPQSPGGREFGNKGKLIHDRLDGYSNGGSTGTSGVSTTGTLEERIENALKTQGGDSASSSNSGNSFDSPRSVQTLTFGPDGSQQQVRPQTESVRPPAQEQQASTGYTGGGIVISTEPSAGEAPAPAPEVAAAQPVAQQPAPSFGSAQVDNSNTQLASVAEPARTPQISEGPSGTGGFFVQIGARNDPDAATSAFSTLQSRYASIIGNLSPSVRKADLGQKGVWYRLLIGPVATKAEADGLCEQLKAAGMKGCFSRKD